MASTWVYLARHGEVLHAAEGRFFGHTDVALSPAGLAQAAALGQRLGAEPIEAVYASDLLRARQSAAPLAAVRGTGVVVVPTLREMAMGRWEGLTFAEIRAREPELWTGGSPIPSGCRSRTARAWQSSGRGRCRRSGSSSSGTPVAGSRSSPMEGPTA